MLLCLLMPYKVLQILFFRKYQEDNLNEYRDRWKGEDRDFPQNNNKAIQKLKFMFLRKPQILMKSSSSIWHYVLNVKSTLKILSIFVVFLENMNFTDLLWTYLASNQWTLSLSPSRKNVIHIWQGCALDRTRH